MGGIAASLMHGAFVAESRWSGVRFIAGLLDGAPALSLQLSMEELEFGANDLASAPIEERVPDYRILDEVEYKYPVSDAYFGYASRGCVRKCRFCGVPKLEGGQKEMPPLGSLVEGVKAQHGEKKESLLKQVWVGGIAPGRSVPSQEPPRSRPPLRSGDRARQAHAPTAGCASGVKRRVDGRDVIVQGGPQGP